MKPVERYVFGIFFFHRDNDRRQLADVGLLLFLLNAGVPSAILFFNAGGRWVLLFLFHRCRTRGKFFLPTNQPPGVFGTQATTARPV